MPARMGIRRIARAQEVGAITRRPPFVLPLIRWGIRVATPIEAFHSRKRALVKKGPWSEKGYGGKRIRKWPRRQNRVSATRRRCRKGESARIRLSGRR